MKNARWFVCAGIWLVFAQACGGCSDTAGPGEVCDPDVAEPCEGSDFELTCRADGEGAQRCLHPDGGRCDTGEDPSICGPDASCVAPSEGEAARCLLAEAAACDRADDNCAPGLVCEETESGEDRCHTELYVQGQVFDSASLDAIEGAQIIAFNGEGSALSDVSVSD